MKQVIKTDKAPAAIGPYSAGFKAGDYIFVSGQGPLNPRTGKIENNTIEEQTRQTLENIKAILEAGGSSMADVVKVSVLLTDLANFKAMNEVYKTFFSEPFPARITYGTGLALPNMLIEIDAVAYLGK
ncbi:MAG: Rid family detoxifying hydrolase [Dehalococcoidia bacterium]|nr:reactive intermediate/imine deaminase [Chloroflexota bacterium]MCK4221910.1 Rid family detoxifying hydrolase [Dehalococcoidia bacterium]MCK4580625.1 Rid family detoxifying hydrolase [Dehalococcoidia bacterium]